MPETPDLLHDPEWTARISAHTDLPRFEDIAVRASARTRRRRVVLGGVAGVTAVAVALGAWQLRGGPSAEPAPVGPATSGTSTTSTPAKVTAPTEVASAEARDQMARATAHLAGFDDGGAQLAVDPQDSDLRAVLRVCRARCGGVTGVLTLSSDGFTSQNVVPITGPRPHAVHAAGAGRFTVTSERGYSLYRPGAPEAIEVASTRAAAPAAEGEWILARDQEIWALDPVTAVQHPVPWPDGVPSFSTTETVGGRIAQPVREGATTRIHTSDDGGATWQVGDLWGGDWRVDGHQVVPALPGSHHWVPVVGDGSGGGINSVHDSADGITWRRTAVPSLPVATLTSVRDDALVLAIDEASSSPDRGLFSLVDGELEAWGDPVPGGVRHVLTLEPAGPVVVLSTDGTVWMSPDATDWQRTRIRV